jgi:transposase
LVFSSSPEASVLGRVAAQGSLLQTRLMRKGLVTKGSFYERLATHGDEFISDDTFAHLYAKEKGRPSIPPSVMIRALLCATHDKLTSDMETSRRTRVDSDWKAAMGVDDWFAGIGATTFSLMRARMTLHDADKALFEKTLERAVELGVFKQKITAIIDSSPVHGAGAVADTFELIRKLAGKLARAMGERLDAELAAEALTAAAVKPDIDWNDKEARKDQLERLVLMAIGVLDAAAASDVKDEPAVVEAAGLLAQVVDQDVEVDGDRLAIRQGVAPDRVISHSDPEMRHGRKSASRKFDGHKMDVVTDEDSELVLGVDVRAGNASDADGTVALLEQVQGVPGIEVETLLGDMAYSGGDTREAVETKGVTLVAKVPQVSNGGRFPKTDFKIDVDAQSVTCPAGHTTTDSKPVKDHKGRAATRYVFDKTVCDACPLRDSCIGGKGARTVMVGVHEARIQAARVKQTEPDTKALLRRRCKVERKMCATRRPVVSPAEPGGTRREVPGSDG